MTEPESLASPASLSPKDAPAEPIPAADVTIIGGGIVGLATAMALTRASRARVLLIEAEAKLAAHQTGNNSGVIHSGLYYKPGSHKAMTCRRGREALVRFCEEHDLPYELCGKVVVATRAEQVPVLESLCERGRANGLEGLQRLSEAELREREPHAHGVAGLFVPETGIVDYRAVCDAYAREAEAHGATIKKQARFLALGQARAGELALETTAGTVLTKALVNCAGLQSDRVARACGYDPGVRIVPFRGEYYELTEARRALVKNLIYPVPDPTLPFLGVHFTRRISGAVEAGPNAVLAFKREGYRRTDISARDLWSTCTYGGFWRLCLRFWKTGLGEMARSASKRAFVRALKELVPEIEKTDLAPGGAGVRAQALDPKGKLVDDFHIASGPQMIHVLNAPSPAATASIAIGELIAERAVRELGLAARVVS